MDQVDATKFQFWACLGRADQEATPGAVDTGPVVRAVLARPGWFGALHVFDDRQNPRHPGYGAHFRNMVTRWRLAPVPEVTVHCGTPQDPVRFACFALKKIRANSPPSDMPRAYLLSGGRPIISEYLHRIAELPGAEGRCFEIDQESGTLKEIVLPECLRRPSGN